MSRAHHETGKADQAFAGSAVHAPSPPAIWVVFSGEAEIAWLKWLKPGFRHCFALLHDGRAWVIIDPLAPWTEILVPELDGRFDLAGWFAGQGLTVLPARTSRARRCVPFPAIFTCVEAVKRLIGIHDPLLITPFQLYRYLQRERAARPGTSLMKEA